MSDLIILYYVHHRLMAQLCQQISVVEEIFPAIHKFLVATTAVASKGQHEA